MAFALIDSVMAQHVTGATVTTAAIDTTGADLIVISTAHYASGASTISDSKGNTWTALTTHDDSGIVGARIYYCLNPTVGSGHTFTHNNAFACIMVSAWSGAHASSSFDKENGATGSSNPISTGNIDPSEGNELVIAALGAYFTNYASIDAGFTTVQTANYVSGLTMTGAHAYKIQTSAAAVNPAFTLSAGGFYSGTAIASFKAAAAAGGALILSYMGGIQGRSALTGGIRG